MGYTHRYAYTPSDPAFQSAWPRMVADAGRIVERVQAAGVVLNDDDPDEPPVTDERILVGGSEEDELDGEPLVVHRSTEDLLPFQYDERGVVHTFCKTERFPYDLAVCAILLRCHRLAPGAFTIGSDGAWDEEWADGTHWPFHPEIGARGLVAELFGDTATDDPLVGPVTG